MGALLNPRVAPLHTSTVSAFTDYYRCYRSKVCGTAVCSSTTDRWQRSGTFLRGQGRGRFLILDFNRISGVEVWQIGNEGGFLAAAVNVTANGNRLLLAPAEGADVIVDFTYVTPGGYGLS